MKKDILVPKVDGVHIAVAQEADEAGETQWRVYLINEREERIHGVLVTARGYGERDGEKIKTSTLRYFLDEVDGKTHRFIEPIPEDLFGLNNEYWLSFYLGPQIYDKKYIFLPESIHASHFTDLPILDRKGVLIS